MVVFELVIFVICRMGYDAPRPFEGPPDQVGFDDPLGDTFAARAFAISLSLASPSDERGTGLDAFNSPFGGIFVRRVVVEGSPRLGVACESCLYVRQ